MKNEETRVRLFILHSSFQSGWLSLEKPIPGRALLLEIVSPGELLPGKEHAGQANSAKAGSPQPITDLKRLPEVLFEAVKTKLAEGKVIEGVVVKMGRILPRHFERFARRQGSIDQQHREIVDCI